ncbi:MAG: hypothetical protein OXB93_02110 [Cytophagales bacterium]|nr:hypothetical protein [Cytophagales bacterium]
MPAQRTKISDLTEEQIQQIETELSESGFKIGGATLRTNRSDFHRFKVYEMGRTIDAVKALGYKNKDAYGFVHHTFRLKKGTVRTYILVYKKMKTEGFLYDEDIFKYHHQQEEHYKVVSSAKQIIRTIKEVRNIVTEFADE